MRLAVILLVAAALFIAADRFVLFRLSAGYVDQIARVYDLNRHLASAFTLVGFGFLVVVTYYLGALARWKRIAAKATLLAALIAHYLVLWHITRQQPFDLAGQAIKCYVTTRTSIVYREREGVDPATGLACHPITPDIAERIREYEGGRRPQFVTAEEPVFFDPRTGAPVIWYAVATSGKVELFDLMGFHPRTGMELQPITREIVALWHKQVEEMRAERLRPEPQHVEDPERYGFFDVRNGTPRLWYWKGNDGRYVFFNSDGFHAATGARLRVVTAEVVSQWRDFISEVKRRQIEQDAQQRQREAREQAELAERERVARLQRQQEERERVERNERERLANLQRQREEREQAERIESERLANIQRQREEREQADRVERDRLANLRREQEERALRDREAQARAESERRQAAAECDRLAANPNDQRRPSDTAVAPYELLRANSDRAIAACQSAVRAFPNDLRYQYQLARATQVNAPQDAFPMLQRLVNAGYPAAFDNLGGLYVRLRRNYGEAVRLYRQGAQLNDPDSLVSLAEMVERNHYQPRTAAETKWQLFARAAALGHAGAALALEQERARVEAETVQRQRDSENAQRALEMFRGVIQSFPRQ